MVQVKISGIKKAEDAQWAVNLGADMVDFIFIKQSPRYVSDKLAKRIISTLPPFVLPAGVFADELPEVIKQVVKHCGIKMVQLNGSETPEYCASLKGMLSVLPDVKIIKYFRVADDGSAAAHVQAFRSPEPVIDYILADAMRETVPGAPPVYNWELAEKLKLNGPLILTGGLTPDNIEQAVETVAPYAVEGMEGVERVAKTVTEKIGAGRKDYDKMKEFIKRAKSFL